MSEEDYLKLMASAPPQQSEEFIAFLRANNEVIQDGDYWLVVRNLKRDRPEQRWYTAFSKSPFPDIVPPMSVEFKKWWDWEWRKHPAYLQSVPGRLHIHFIEPVIPNADIANTRSLEP